MSLPTAALRPVDQVDVTVLVDSSVDILLAPSGPAVRPALAFDWSERDQLRAEHGYGLLVRTRIGNETHAVIYDAGLGRGTFLWNCDVLGIRPQDAEAIFLSHGHADHHGGLEAVLGRLGRPGLPIVLHPDAQLERRVVFPSGTTIRMPPPSHADIEREGGRVLAEPGPSLWGGDTILLSGTVDRTTDYEKGFPLQQRLAGSAWIPDTWIWDDQNVVVRVRDRGLVVLSSCSHAGVVNVLRNALRLTGERRIHAFIGGMHLTGGLFEGIIGQTLGDLERLAPDWIVPGHCTGFLALAEVVTRFPHEYLASSVGSRYVFTAPDAGA